ncbi:MAG: GNAT family acetyltransferase [Methylacidiphilales bacterium]|nr:GNAT family acetyltransferase [Candidatus Methylacidiphilales bacterium]
MDAASSTSPSHRIIRPYRPDDRPAIRAICADTGFLGRPIDPVFEDRELFADYLTSYYTDAEPESTFVCELDGEVKGYIMGSRFPKKKAAYETRVLPGLVLRGLWRYITRPYNAASRRYVRWILTQARKEVPFTPPDMPHFHFNIRPEARSVSATRELVDIFLNYLVKCGEKSVYGQVVVYESRRGNRMFERYGFRLVDQREVTKYRDLHSGKVYLFTLVKDLTLNSKLYGIDLHHAEEPDEAAPKKSDSA